MKTILITGGAGFVGSNLAIRLKKVYKKAHVIAFDNLIRRGSELNVPRLKKHGIDFLKRDVRNKKDIQFGKKPISLIIECSAEPSVLAGFNESPDYVIQTNLGGAINCLELARQKKADMIFLSTSRIYPCDKLLALNIKEGKTRFLLREKQPFKGVSVKGINTDLSLDGWRSMYGATKLSAEILIQEYIHMYGLKAVINRCSVIAGPWQMGKVDQGVFGLWALYHFFKKDLSYIGFGGQGKQVRDLLHIDDLCDLVVHQIKNMKKYNGRTFNVGGGKKNSLSLRETTALCQELTGNTIKIKSVKKTREADVPIYITDNTGVTRETGWKPKRSPAKTLSDICGWIKEEQQSLRKVFFK